MDSQDEIMMHHYKQREVKMQEQHNALIEQLNERIVNEQHLVNLCHEYQCQIEKAIGKKTNELQV